jgi:hypothetical protein
MIDKDISGQPVLMKPARAAKMIDCSGSKLYDLVNAGVIRGVRVAGLLRIPLDEIERIAAGNGDGDDERA